MMLSAVRNSMMLSAVRISYFCLMKYLAVLCLAGVLLSGACVHHQPAVASHDSLPGSDSTPKNDFFPVADYLETEILNVDSTPVALVCYRTSNNRTDSAFISPSEFNTLALQFLPPEIRDGGLQRNFTENSFADKTTGSITFSYSPIDKNNALQRIDLQTVQGHRGQEVKSIYMEVRRKAGDSLMLQKMLWASKRNFQIVTLTSVGGSEQQERQVKVVWDKGEEDE
jgi:hypothetical protein